MVDHQRPIPPDAPEQYTVVLPVPPDTFRQFVSGLLGKPQTITKVFRDCFEVRTQDIENTFHLVDQRVRQQNEASLIQFIVRITYDDGSSVLLNTLEDFLHYKEIHPLVSTGVVLSWTYLIRFPEKTVPEKQEIEVTMLADPRQGEARVLHLEELRFFPPSLYFGGQIDIRIAHTARTWGADIEALLTGHIKTLLIQQAPLSRFIYRHSGVLGFALGVLFFGLTMVGAYVTSERFLQHQLALAGDVLSRAGDTLPDLALKVNFLVGNAARGAWTRFNFALALFFLLALALAIFIGVWATVSGDNRRPSFVLLSQKAMERKNEAMTRTKQQWLWFAASILTSIVAGVLSNIIFATFFGTPAR